MDPARLEKVKKLRQLGRNPYAERFVRTGSLVSVSKLAEGKPAKIAGRVVLFRDMGKLTFATLQDESGRLQIAFKEENIGSDEYKLMLKLIDLGDFIGVSGERFNTKKGEPTVLVKDWAILSKALRQPPEKWHGLSDRETAYRQRYLDLMSNRETLDRMRFRSDFIKALREFYWEHDFTEVEIPVLVNSPSGALAKPFTTHHDTLDLDVFLRIALETHQKECLVGGFDRTFSVGPVFRNEGMDPSHLQEFTISEHYAAYWNFEDNMQFTEKMLSTLLRKTRGTTLVKIPNREGKLVEIDFGGEWPVLSIREVIKRDSGIDYEEHKTAESLRQAIKTKKIEIDVDIATLGRGNLIDQLYKKVSRPKITAPTFIIQHPIDLSPLARRNDKNPDITDRFQLVVGGWEIVNAYSELVDPADQAQRFKEQAEARAHGDHEAHCKDDEFVEALEYGCPPCSGWGMGLDRLISLLTCQENLRDVVLFPLMKPEGKRQTQPTKKIQSAKSPLPDEKSKRFVAILNEKVDSGKLMNALGHMTAGLSALAGQAENLCFLRYEDKDGGTHPNISHFPFIVLKAENGNQIRKIREQAKTRNVPFTDFTSTMTVGTSGEQRDATKKTPEAELEYYGICLFGDTAKLRELTKKFSLFK
jgi:lysyl-tRNA synthetase class 2